MSHICDEWEHIQCYGIPDAAHPERSLAHICEACFPKVDLLRQLLDKARLTPVAVRNYNWHDLFKESMVCSRRLSGMEV